MSKIRKALAAAAAGFVAGAAAYLKGADALDAKALAAAAGAGVTAALLAFIATYLAPKNADVPAK